MNHAQWVQWVDAGLAWGEMINRSNVWVRLYRRFLVSRPVGAVVRLVVWVTGADVQ